MQFDDGRRSGENAAATVVPALDSLIADKNILIIDALDSQAQRTLGELLTNAGGVVTTCSDRTEALTLVASGRFDVVISHIHLDGHSCLDIFRQAMQAAPDLKFIFMTGFGYDPSHTMNVAHSEGLAGALYSGTEDPAALAAKIVEALESPSRPRENTE